MKIKSLLILMLSVCLMITVCACGGNTGDDSTNTTGSTTTTTAATTTTTTTEATTTTTQAQDSATNYTVKVVDEEGNPVAGIMVQWCLESCVPGVTKEDGVAAPISPLPEAEYKVSVIESSLAAGGYAVEGNEFYYEDGSYEMTIVLKKAA